MTQMIRLPKGKSATGHNKAGKLRDTYVRAETRRSSSPFHHFIHTRLLRRSCSRLILRGRSSVPSCRRTSAFRGLPSSSSSSGCEFIIG
jgi:hypothetical protein